MELLFPRFVFRGKYFPAIEGRNIFHGIPILPSFLSLESPRTQAADVCSRNKSFFLERNRKNYFLGDEQSGKREIGAAICSENRPFLPAFSFKKKENSSLLSRNTE